MMARSLIVPLVLFSLAACVLSKHGADRGIAYLGSFTFYRVVDGTRDVLVRFDQKHHWHTGFDEAFEELAAQVRPYLSWCASRPSNAVLMPPTPTALSMPQSHACAAGCIQPPCQLLTGRLP